VPLNYLQRSERWLNSDGTPTNRFAEVIEELTKEILEMTTNAFLFRERPSGTSPVNVYTAPTSKNTGGRGTVITQFVAGGSSDYSVYIGTVADLDTLILTSTATLDGDCPMCLINQIVKPGDSIWVEAAVGNNTVFYASGIERR